MTDQRDVQQMIQGLTPSAVNNGNPQTVYNQPGGQGGYVPPTFDPATNTWRINPSKPATPVNWQQMAMSQPQPNTSPWNTARPQVPPGTGVPPTTPVPNPTPQPPPPPPTINPTTETPGYDTWKRRQDPNFVYEEGAKAACVVVDSFLADYDRAGDVKVGDVMVVIDPTSFRRDRGSVSHSETKTVPCVRITTETGIKLDCSTTATIADESGQEVVVLELLNKLIPVCDNGAYFLDRVASIEELGDLEVQHITVENNYFLAGKEKGRYIFHHNMKMVEGKGMDLLGMYSNRDAQFGGWGGNFNTMERTPNTRGAMQQNGSWYNRPGIAQPVGSGWDGNLQSGQFASTNGTDYLKEFQTASDPLTMYKSAGAWLTGSATPTNVSVWNPRMTDPVQAPNLGGVAPTTEAPAKEAGFWQNLDNNRLGNLKKDGEPGWNWGNIASGIASLYSGVSVNGLRINDSIKPDGNMSYARNMYTGYNSNNKQELATKVAEARNITVDQAHQLLGGQ